MEHPKVGRLSEFTILEGKHPSQRLVVPQATAPANSAAPPPDGSGAAELITPFLRGTHLVADLVWGETRQKLELSWPAAKTTPISVGRFTLVEAHE